MQFPWKFASAFNNYFFLQPMKRPFHITKTKYLFRVERKKFLIIKTLLKGTICCKMLLCVAVNRNVKNLILKYFSKKQDLQS